jgi:hypothetical protein
VNNTGLLWFVANVLVAVLAVMIGYYNSVLLAIGVWAALTLLLLWFHPE